MLVLVQGFKGMLCFPAFLFIRCVAKRFCKTKSFRQLMPIRVADSPAPGARAELCTAVSGLCLLLGASRGGNNPKIAQVST